MQSQIHLWLFTYAHWWDSEDAFWHYHDKIWTWLQSIHHLRCKLQGPLTLYLIFISSNLMFLQVKEYGYNRELKRFMELSILTDGFHEKNHTTCSSAFKSSKYCSLKNVNTEAAEQTNKWLRSISSSTTYMSPHLYMRTLTLFIGNLNILANMKKQ